MASNLPDQPGGQDEWASVTGAALTTLAELARERLAVQREQQAVALRGWEVTDNIDRRQSETFVKSIKADTEKDKRRHRPLVGALLAAAGIPSLFLLLLLLMVFFGSPTQSAIALRVLSIVGTGIGGAGVVFLVGYGINRLIAR